MTAHVDDLPCDDWWYVRAYPPPGAGTDGAARVLLPWLAEQAAAQGAHHWSFLRYVDVTGQHLRLRVRCSSAAVDRLHGRIAEVVDLLGAAPSAPAVRLLPGADFGADGEGPVVVPDLYSPEHVKYGGRRGVELAEALFARSSAWHERQDVSATAPATTRASAALALLRTAVDAALPAEAHGAFWSDHRRQWGWHLRLLLPTREQFSARLAEVRDGVRAAEVDDDLLAGAVERGQDVAETLERAQAEGIPVAREALLLHYLHMELNRCGFVPAEECLLGAVGATTGATAAP